MADIVVTVPMAMWPAWLSEGDLAGFGFNPPDVDWGGYDSHFWIRPSGVPIIEPGERVYVVAHGRLRGYAPLVRTEHPCRLRRDRACLVRRGGAVAVTIDEPIRGFRGWRYRWWNWADERPFPEWMEV